MYKDCPVKIITNICSNNLSESTTFYMDLLGLQIKYHSDWYVQLCSPDDSEIEYGIIQRDHELVPKEYRQPPNGIYVTFVVPNVDNTYEKALKLNLPIVKEPTNEFYGQRRFLTKDPSGCLIDICSPF
ncbi:MAG: catechol 2,3-dioxygenase-like lactoylglutathione lyase family enzyme [Alteromonadaceae bacterium]|jgi:catechol 2,3-dioxygenase-like lactoylglutathione lyase family enzyme